MTVVQCVWSINLMNEEAHWGLLRQKQSATLLYYAGNTTNYSIIIIISLLQ